MKAIIFNSGLGHRMGDETKTHHKCIRTLYEVCMERTKHKCLNGICTYDDQ